MKMITLENIRSSLETMLYPVEIDPAMVVKARRAVDRMLAVNAARVTVALRA